MASLVLTVHDAKPRLKPDLFAVSSLSQKHNLNQPVRDFLVKPQESVHYLPFPTSKKGQSAWQKPFQGSPLMEKVSWLKNNPFFSFVNRSFAPPFLLLKLFRFVQFLRAPF